MSGLTATSGSLNDLYFTSTAPTLNYSTGANTGLETSGDGLYLMGGDGSNLNVLSPSTTTGTIPISGSTYDAEAAQRAAQQDLYRQGLNTSIAGMENDLRVLGEQENAALGRVNTGYDTTKGRLTADYGTGQQNLQRATGQVNEGKERSLTNLRSWLQGMGQGYQNQLGAMGAGDSSAAGLINFALGQQGSRERGGILQDAQGQLENIDLQGQQLQVDFTRAIEDLDKWKQDTIFDITSQYQQAKQSINNNILDARARAAAEMELTQEAVSYLQQLESQYRTNADAVIAQYQSIANPNTSLNQGLLNFNTAPVRQASLNGLNMPNQVNPESGITAFNRRRDDEILSNPMGA